MGRFDKELKLYKIELSQERVDKRRVGCAFEEMSFVNIA